MMDFMRIAAASWIVGMMIFAFGMGVTISQRDDAISWMGPPLILFTFSFGAIGFLLFLIERHLNTLANKQD